MQWNPAFKKKKKKLVKYRTFFHSFIRPLNLFSAALRVAVVCWSLSQLPRGECRDTPWTSYSVSSYSGTATLTDEQSLTLTQKHTYGQFRVSQFAARLRTVGGSRSTRREPSHTQREHANSTHKGLSILFFKKDNISLVFFIYYLFSTFLHLLSKTGVRNEVKTCEHMEGMSHVSISVYLACKGLVPKSLPLLFFCLKWEMPASAKRQEA